MLSNSSNHKRPMAPRLFITPSSSTCDSRGGRNARRVMNGPQGDYTARECKAATLRCDKSYGTPRLPRVASLQIFPSRPLLTSLPGITLPWDEIDCGHAGHVRRKLILEGIKDIFTDDGHYHLTNPEREECSEGRFSSGLHRKHRQPS